MACDTTRQETTANWCLRSTSPQKPGVVATDTLTVADSGYAADRTFKLPGQRPQRAGTTPEANLPRPSLRATFSLRSQKSHGHCPQNRLLDHEHTSAKGQ